MIEVLNVSKTFGGVVANQAISLEVAPGRITGLIGPNGSGKTTLFKSITGAHPIDAGSIRFKGREIAGLEVQEITRLGIVRTFQQTRVYGGLEALANMLVSVPQQRLAWHDMLRRSSAAEREKALELLDFVGLAEKRHLLAGELSFGEQKLLELAMALMNEPEVLLLDEPTAGINPTRIAGVMERLERLNEVFGLTLFVIEHNMRVIMSISHRIYCLAHGELLASGTPETIRNDQRVIDAYLGAH
jgi:branched-chain amino acid transport system ATP-binding protein